MLAGSRRSHGAIVIIPFTRTHARRADASQRSGRPCAGRRLGSEWHEHAHLRAAGLVTYTWATNAAPDVTCTATIPATEFLRRFARHILPPGFHRIRFRGLWCTAHRATKLHVVQRWFAMHRPLPPPPAPPAAPPERPLGDDPCGLHDLRPGPLAPCAGNLATTYRSGTPTAAGAATPRPARPDTRGGRHPRMML